MPKIFKEISAATDAIDYGVGAFLTQDTEDGEVVYTSRTLIGAGKTTRLPLSHNMGN